MRKLRIVVGILFLVSLCAFLVYTITTRIMQDHTPPVITSSRDTISVSVKDLEQDDSALLKGLKASDDKDGDLTDKIRLVSMSHFTEPGVRTAEYAVFDSSNNAATLQRTVKYTDYTSPEIHLKSPLIYSMDNMNDNDMDLAENMTATDCLDGNITSQIRATFDNNAYVDRAGNYEITVQVSNSAGDTCRVPLIVTFTDPEDEKETERYYPLLSDYIVYTDVGEKVSLRSLIVGFEHNGTEYLSDEDGYSLSADIRDVDISGKVDYSKAGTYPVTYTYTSSDGTEASTSLTVVVR